MEKKLEEFFIIPGYSLEQLQEMKATDIRSSELADIGDSR